MVDHTGRRYVIFIVRQTHHTNHLAARITIAGFVYRYIECLLVQHGIRTIPYFIYFPYRHIYIIAAAAAANYSYGSSSGGDSRVGSDDMMTVVVTFKV